MADTKTKHPKLHPSYKLERQAAPRFEFQYEPGGGGTTERPEIAEDEGKKPETRNYFVALKGD